ncbi:MAG: hypothetical protein QG646_1301 [Euryarchaeota archaeon]|nr:hypothetical protein [Euryarchaeota archaeon]
MNKRRISYTHKIYRSIQRVWAETVNAFYLIIYMLISLVIIASTLFCCMCVADISMITTVGNYAHCTLPLEPLDFQGANGRIWIHNNISATDPTYDELIRFIREDNTDSYEYNSYTFVCADYAKYVHDNAEKAGIRAAVVEIGFKGGGEGHACNVFNTTDRGLVFIDCTEYDCIVTCEKGKSYSSQGIGKDKKYIYPPLGVVAGYDIYW